MAEALLDAYRTGTPAALERHYRLAWHRRSWQAMRKYVQLDLGRRPAFPDDPMDISLDDARYLVAIEQGFDSWESLKSYVGTMPGMVPFTAKPMIVVRLDDARRRSVVARTRDWEAALRLLEQTRSPGLGVPQQMTDDMMRGVASADPLEALHVPGSRLLTDEGVRHLAGLSNLRHVDLSGTGITDRGLAALRDLRKLEVLNLAGTRVTDEGLTHLANCEALTDVDLGWTRTGDGAIRALAGKPRLNRFTSGDALTNDGLAMLRDWPAFQSRHLDARRSELFTQQPVPNWLLLRGAVTDAGLRHLAALEGLVGLDLGDRRLSITPQGLGALADLPGFGWLAIAADDAWMPAIAALPHLRTLSIQDTPASDKGFVALARSRSIESLWGRRGHNLRRTGFLALSGMPRLRSLSVSCLHVDDEGVAALPRFPALRELMPMDVPDAGYRHIARCDALESLVLMYCRNTTDAATEHLVGLPSLISYFNSYTAVTDRTPQMLSRMDTLERITFDSCHELTDQGVAALARLARLRELRVSGRGITGAVGSPFAATVTVNPEDVD